MVQKKREKEKECNLTVKVMVESDDEGPRAKIDVKAKNYEIGIIVERCL